MLIHSGVLSKLFSSVSLLASLSSNLSPPPGVFVRKSWTNRSCLFSLCQRRVFIDFYYWQLCDSSWPHESWITLCKYVYVHTHVHSLSERHSQPVSESPGAHRDAARAKGELKQRRCCIVLLEMFIKVENACFDQEGLSSRLQSKQLNNVVQVMSAAACNGMWKKTLVF